ncbi:DUF4123 domain-containing protein [Paraburkholderia metrosideri]|jgi:hypothetical protein|uniref:DUF4123 domain-containing protein n=1 Tax=Paraburkholderia metrosideri TaxID=580937 RepID=A0ABM8NWX3_9BURK|nr:DUF4123 domain-containing protein [Paraburkholderia metrosideri]CAD6547235.1 hypothetical protein LMG28140_04443 [Paraburkholderia metrosideri]
MSTRFAPLQSHLYAVVDAAARPERIYPLLQQSGKAFRSAYAGLPEEALGPASLFVIPVDDTGAEWFRELDRIDLYSPCLSMVWSYVDLDSLVTHLQAFLFADIGDNMTALVRFFDPRNTGAVFGIWGEQIRSIFMSPIERWMYRGRHRDTQSITNDAPASQRTFRSILIQFDQADIDALMAHTEPDELLATLIETDIVDGKPAYCERFADFLPRYQQAIRWDLTEPADRLVFCQHTYRYGMSFDRNPEIQNLLSGHKATGESLGVAIKRISGSVWEQIEYTRDFGTVEA